MIICKGVSLTFMLLICFLKKSLMDLKNDLDHFNYDLKANRPITTNKLK